MNVPGDLKYTENDEWVRVDGEKGTVGITDFAQNQLSDIVYVEMVVAVGEEISQGDTIATLESVKAAADVYAPVGGKVEAINEELPDTPEMVNSDPYGAAWLVQLKIADLSELDELLDSNSYQQKIETQE